MEVGRRSHKGGEWRTFLHDQVTPCFPEGLTGWDAQGQRCPEDGSVSRESAKVLVVVHDSRPKA